MPSWPGSRRPSPRDASSWRISSCAPSAPCARRPPPTSMPRPPGLDGEVTGVAIMGGLERVAQESGSTDPRRPRLHVHALAIMGGIEVKILKPGDTWNDEKEESA